MPSSEGALRELLGSSSVYSHDRQDIQSYAEAKVAWPAIDSQPINLVDVLPSGDCELLCDWRRTMLCDDHTAYTNRIKADVKCVHNDPVLFRSPRQYSRFVKQVESRGMLKYKRAAGAEGKLGVFFVKNLIFSQIFHPGAKR